MIFSRGRGSGRHAKGDEAPRGTRHTETRRGTRHTTPSDDTDELGFDELARDDSWEPAGRSYGPYDVSEDAPDVPHLDLGALRIPATEGVEVRMQADNDGAIQQVVLVNGESALQLGVFAAPRSEGIWDEVRAEIRKQLFNDGVAAEEADGEYGTQLRARVRTPEGLTDIRFVGIDGPRWMVRAVFQGPAAVDPALAQPLVDCLRGVVVDRGHEAMPVREPLRLRLPREVADQAAAHGIGPDQLQGGEPGHDQGAGPAGADSAAGGTNGAPGPVTPSAGGQRPRRKPSPRPRPR